MTDTTPAAVERLSWSPTDMVQMNGHGDYVHHSDYAALSAQLVTARAEGKAEGLRESVDVVWTDAQNLDAWTRNFVRKAILALIPAETPAAKVTLGFLRPIWKDHSGEWHGPKVERWSIPEDQMVTFFNAALRAIAGEKL